MVFIHHVLHALHKVELVCEANPTIVKAQHDIRDLDMGILDGRT
jgi:hypothetical protein